MGTYMADSSGKAEEEGGGILTDSSPASFNDRTIIFAESISVLERFKIDLVLKGGGLESS